MKNFLKTGVYSAMYIYIYIYQRVLTESEPGLHNFGECSQFPSTVNWFYGYTKAIPNAAHRIPFRRNTRKLFFTGTD